MLHKNNIIILGQGESLLPLTKWHGLLIYRATSCETLKPHNKGYKTNGSYSIKQSILVFQLGKSCMPQPLSEFHTDFSAQYSPHAHVPSLLLLSARPLQVPDDENFP